MRLVMTKTIRIILLAILLFTIVTGVISIYRSYHSSNDFDTYYAAGKAVLQGEGIYYPKSAAGQASNEVSPFLYPPIAACFFALLAWMPLGLAAFLWNAVNIVLFFATAVLIFQFLDLDTRQFPHFLRALNKWDLMLFGAIGLSFLIDNLSMAQVNIVVFFIVLASLLLWKRGWHVSAGFVLSTAILIKVTPLLFCLYFALKRAWKLWAGVLLGGLLFTIVIPGFIFGWEGNRLNHRQWLGRTVKPLVIDLTAAFKKEPPHPEKKSVEEYRMMRLTNHLIQANQTFEAVMTRLFLKDRNDYGPERGFPIYVIRHYQNLPVIGGGISMEMLSVLVRVFQLIFILILVYLWSPYSAPPVWNRISFEVALVFLTMTLFSPLTRSQHLVVWLFGYGAGLWALWEENFSSTFRRCLIWFLRAGSVVYLLQVVPYGQAVGMGMWANLILWIGFVIARFQLTKELR